MPRRSGVTLVEVLVAIFVMGIGLIALLTLFPIGILRMGQSIRHDRCTQSAINAYAIAVMQNVCNDPLVVSPAAGGGDYFRNPNPAPKKGSAAGDAEDYGPSYAVFVDPGGYVALAGLGLSKNWVTGQNTNNLRRRPTSFATTQAASRRWFSLLDETLFYNSDQLAQLPGTPQNFGGSYVRDSHFSWAYLLRRPQTRDTSVVECTIVVFENRPLLGLQGIENAFSATFDLTTNSITVMSAVPPNVRPGDWVYDGSILPGANGKIDIPACFYRVVAVDQGGAAVRFEVATPIRPLRSSPAATSYPGTLIVMENIAEVYERGPIRLP